MNKCWLLMGGNMGNRMAYLNAAETLIIEEIGSLISYSKVYESEAWGVENQNSFLNKILIIETELKPDLVLEKCLEIEKSLGRERLQKWTRRVIDIDILYYNDLTINNANLTIPHPEIQNRRFVLEPLCELTPNYNHPIFQITNNKLLENCTDTLRVWEYHLT